MSILVPERKERKDLLDAIFEKNNGLNFSKLMRDSKPQIQKSLRKKENKSKGNYIEKYHSTNFRKSEKIFGE